MNDTFFIHFQQAITKQGAFWFFAGMCILLLLFVVFIVPETKGKTLEEIEKIFDNNGAAADEARDEANNLLNQVKNLEQDSSHQDYGSTS